MRVLVVNAGSSSLKLRLLDGERLAGEDTLVAEAGRFDVERLAAAIHSRAGSVDAVGHRVVHGGEGFTGPVRIDTAVLARIAELTPLAPIHQPAALAAIRVTEEVLPAVPAVACFDTGFHATLPEAARTYAVPREWRERHGVRRFGFHGLSHAWIARRSAALSPGADRIVSCHLGSGASLCAIAGGCSVDTTMGMTPLEGLVMGTRAGTVDPGALLLVQTWEGIDAAEMYDRLDRESGLKGLAGTGDMRELLARDRAGDADARLAREVYVHRLAVGVAGMVASLGGLDVLTFTGGIGENDADLRTRTAARLGFLGVAIDAVRNHGVASEAEVSAAGAAVRTLVIAAREDLEIARQVRLVAG